VSGPPKQRDKHYDLIAIGGGSGGLAVAEQAAKLGRRVAIVESNRLGGTCVNNGCVPKKVMWYAASLAQAVDDAAGFGIPARRGVTDWHALVSGRDRYIENINGYWDGHVAEHGIDHIDGHASFVAHDTVEVGGVRYTADHIVIATGSEPIVPALPGAELGITSDGFFDLKEQPGRVAVIGGGYIAVELGGMLHTLGSEVTLIALEDRLLERFDPMISRVMERNLRSEGVRVETGRQVTSLSGKPGRIGVHCANGTIEEQFDTVIWAVGRRPNTQGLNVQAAGLELLSGGAIPVDEFEDTAVTGIHAIGDVTGKLPLTPVAIAAGRRLAERLFGQQPDSRVDYDNIPSVVFSHPPIGMVGMDEAEARRRHGDTVTVYSSEFTPMRHALSPHSPVTAMKLVCVGDKQRVAGIHVIGEGADEMLQGFAVAMKLGATKADLDRTIAIHPTSAEELVTMKQPDAGPAHCADVDTGLEWQEAC
jgi:glutathione-disulfide reductase